MRREFYRLKDPPSSMQSPDLSQNYFELFGLKPVFAIDPVQLKGAQQSLQASYHPIDTLTKAIVTGACQYRSPPGSTRLSTPCRILSNVRDICWRSAVLKFPMIRPLPQMLSF